MQGDDNVVSCMVSNGVGSVAQMYTYGKSTPVLLDGANPGLGLARARLSYANGVETCTFTRLMSSGSAVVPGYYDIQANAFYLLVALGYMAGGSTKDCLFY